MADTIQITADTNPAVSALDRLVNKLGDVERKFSDTFDKMNAAALALGATLTGLAVSTATFADNLVDIADANQLAVGEVLALSSALQAAGGKADNTGQVLQRLAMSVEDANSGNAKLINSFGRMGISVSDLGRLSDTEIRDKLLTSIAAIENPMERNARAAEFFGKSLAGVDIRKFAQDQQALRAESEKYADSLQTASDAFASVEKLLKNIKIAFAEAFQPFFAIIKDLNVSVDALVVGFKGMAIALGILVGAGTIRGILALKDAFILLNTVVSKNPLIALGAAAGGLLATLGIIKGTTKATEELNKEAENGKPIRDQAFRDQTGLNDLLEKQRNSISKSGQALQDNFEQARRRYQVELDSYSLTEEGKKQAQARAQIDKDADTARSAAQAAFDALDKGSQDRQRKFFDEQLAGIESNRAAQKAASDEAIADIDRRNAAIRQGQSQVSFVDQILQSIEQRRLALDKETAGVNTRIELEQRLIEIQAVRSALSKEIATLSADDQTRAQMALVAISRDTSLLTANYSDFGSTLKDNITKYGQALGVSSEGIGRLVNQTKGLTAVIQEIGPIAVYAGQELERQARTFEQGWNKALVNFRNEATNAATQAEKVFGNLTKGLEDAFVNFAKTGKLSFKELLGSIAEDILRSNIKQLLNNLFSPGQGGGGGIMDAIFGGFRNLLGFANGGIIPTNNPVVVGERGPELLVGAAGNRVIPNDQLGGGTVVNYNINAVDAASFKSLVAKDPAFIHAVASQGGKMAPTRR
jgi:hypothetical protein